MSEPQSRQVVEEGTRECDGMDHCPECGTVTRHTVDLRLEQIPVDSFSDLCRQHSRQCSRQCSRRWPGALVEQVADGYRLIVSHPCGCAQTPEADGTGA